MSSRPELRAPPEIFYDDSEARKYTSSSRIIEIQALLLALCLQLPWSFVWFGCSKNQISKFYEQPNRRLLQFFDTFCVYACMYFFWSYVSLNVARLSFRKEHWSCLLCPTMEFPDYCSTLVCIHKEVFGMNNLKHLYQSSYFVV